MQIDMDLLKTVISVVAVLGGAVLASLKIINRLTNGKNGNKTKPGDAPVCREHEKAITELGTLMKVVRDETIPKMESNLKDHIDIAVKGLEKSINGHRRR